MNKHNVSFVHYYAAGLLAFVVLYLLLSYHGAAYAIPTTCNGSIAECSELQTELVFDSEVSRRFMAAKKYISTGALRKDQPTCGGGARGEAYSKNSGCGLPSQSNPHSPGCSKYYRCRSGD